MRAATADALHHGIEQMALCFDAAGRRNPEWGEDAYRFLLRWVGDIASPDVPFSAEDLTDAATARGLVAHDARAWGAIFLRAARDGVIRRSTTTFRRRNGHGAPTFGWEKCR